jgi:hypothetical protein
LAWRKEGALVGLPLVFVIGDSISMQYGPFLERMLDGRYRYARKTGLEPGVDQLDPPANANGGDSSMVMRYVRALLSDAAWRADVLLVNCGLHDIKVDRQTGELQVPPERYVANLREVLALLGERAGRLVWVRTTPVDDETHNEPSRGFTRHEADVAEYNRLADREARSAGAAIVDLHSLTASLGGPGELYCDHVHFVDAVRRLQAAYLAGFVDALGAGGQIASVL